MVATLMRTWTHLWKLSELVLNHFVFTIEMMMLVQHGHMVVHSLQAVAWHHEAILTCLLGLHGLLLAHPRAWPNQ